LQLIKNVRSRNVFVINLLINNFLDKPVQIISRISRANKKKAKIA